jgi:HMG box factor, other
LLSPGSQRVARQYPSMSPHQSNSHYDERDDVGPLSPDSKRRRFNGDHPVSVTRAMPPRYGAVPAGAAVGPGTPFPFGQAPPVGQQYPVAVAQPRRESLPGLRGMVSPPGTMAPPPRPGMGYQQHRLSQGHVGPDRSLTLPPIQTGHPPGPETASDPAKMTEEQITTARFRYKIKVLGQVAPAAPRIGVQRGPLIAIEGDSPDVASKLATWMNEELSRTNDLTPNLLAGPVATPHGNKEQMMAQYHRLAAEWLDKSASILHSITIPAGSTDAAMADAAPVTTPPTDENKVADKPEATDGHSKQDEEHHDTGTHATEKDDAAPQKMDLDKRASTISTASTTSARGPKPVSIVANYTLHASTKFACAIPIGGIDMYSASDHWQWAASQWRGIIGPDLTIYVQDLESNDTGRPPVEIEPVASKSDAAVFVVRRTKDVEQMVDVDEQQAGIQLDPSALRRIGFEVGEWIRAFKTGSNRA